MIRAGIETEIAPIVGTEQQAEDLIKYIRESPERGESIWGTQYIWEIHPAARRRDSQQTGHDQRRKPGEAQDTMQKIVNDSKGRLVCIINCLTE